MLRVDTFPHFIIGLAGFNVEGKTIPEDEGRVVCNAKDQPMVLKSIHPAAVENLRGNKSIRL